MFQMDYEVLLSGGLLMLIFICFLSDALHGWVCFLIFEVLKVTYHVSSGL